MKKVVSLVLVLLIFCSLAISVNAEEFNGGDLFTVNLPEGFEQKTAAVTDYSFINETGDTFAMNYTENTEEEKVFSPADMSKKDIEEYMNFITQESKSVMKDFADEFDIEFLSGEKVKHRDEKTALVCRTKVTITKDEKTAVYYQTMYEFGGVNNKYSFTYTTADEKRKDSFKEVFDSIDIFEGETQSNLDKFSTYAVAGVMALLLFMGIVRFIKTPEKRAKGKLK